MEWFILEVVGKEANHYILDLFRENAVKTVKTVNNGTLGNLTVLTYKLPLDGENPVEDKRRLTRMITRSGYIDLLYYHGNGLKAMAIKHNAIKNRD